MNQITVFATNKIKKRTTEQCVFFHKNDYCRAGKCSALTDTYCKKEGCNACGFYRDKDETIIRTTSYAGRMVPEFVTKEEAGQIDKRREKIG